MSAPVSTLVVDLDGTLTPSDTLLEAGIRLVRSSPLCVFAMLARWVTGGRAALKRFVALRADFRPEGLLYREDFLDYLRAERERGRRLVLATASDRLVADAVAAHLGLFDLVLATDGGPNLKGARKLAAIRAHVGEDFVYAGDSPADLPVWRGARGAVLVGTSAPVARAARAATRIESEFPRGEIGLATWARALRLHQWLKNLLVFVPAFTAFSLFDPTVLLPAAVAFLSLSLVASATYIANDIWDLENDRAHPRKRTRPLASGLVPLALAGAVAAGLLLAGLGLALLQSVGLFIVVCAYLLTTTTYSWVLKQYVLVDVIVLALLYTLRILAGAVATQVEASTWLLAFSVFVFLSLALIKRCSELVTLAQAGQEAPRGRDYRVGDLQVLWPLGVGAAMASAVVFGLFISAASTTARYGSPQLMWLVALALVYWLARLWIKTARGEMHDDPLVFALRDGASRLVLLLMSATVIAARYLELEFTP